MESSAACPVGIARSEDAQASRIRKNILKWKRPPPRNGTVTGAWDNENNACALRQSSPDLRRFPLRQWLTAFRVRASGI